MNTPNEGPGAQSGVIADGPQSNNPSYGAAYSGPTVSPMLADASERQALLHARPPVPCCERLLFAISNRILWDMLITSFVVHLYYTDKLDEFGHDVVVTVIADILFAILLVLSLLLMAVALLNFKLETPTMVIAEVTWTWFLATLAWYALLRISVLHHDNVFCWHGCSDGEEIHLASLSDFLKCWRWCPIGLLQSFLAVLWRPWWFFFFVTPQALVGGGPLFIGLPWWQVREVIIGSVLQPTAVVVIAMSRQIEEDWRTAMLLSVSLSVCVAAIPFYLTTAPVVTFWAFLLRPWRLVLGNAFHGKTASLSTEEWLAMFVMTWQLTRVVYIVASMRLEEWSAHRRVEEGLRYALEHPFRAQLDQGFGEAIIGDVEQGEGFLRRSLSQIAGGGAKEDENKFTLKEKRKTLQDLSREWRGTAAVPSRMSLQVRRSNLLEDSFKALASKPVTELLAPNMSVRYEDELGSDAGGLTRDWFDSVARLLAEGADDISGDSLLITGPDQTLVPRPAWQDTGEVPNERQERFRSLLAMGRFLALAVYRDTPLPLSFSLVACKHMLRIPVGMADVQRLDPEFYRFHVMAVLKEGGLQELEIALGEPLVFTSAPTQLRPEPEELKENGANIIVTEGNKTEYVQLLCEAHLCGGIRREIQCMLQGFWDILPLVLLNKSKVTPRDLSMLISGTRNLDPEDWRRHSVCRNTGGSNGEKVLEWFWEIVGELDEEQRCMLLHFATGSSRLPPAGFCDLQPHFSVCVHDGREDRLPVAHTCSNQLDLQEYQSKELVREKLTLAIHTESFELL